MFKVSIYYLSPFIIYKSPKINRFSYFFFNTLNMHLQTYWKVFCIVFWQRIASLKYCHVFFENLEFIHRCSTYTFIRKDRSHYLYVFPSPIGAFFLLLWQLARFSKLHQWETRKCANCHLTRRHFNFCSSSNSMFYYSDFKIPIE